MKFNDILIAIVLSILWGINYVAIKVGVMQFPPIFMMGLRFIIVAVFLLPAIVQTPRDKWFELFLISVTMGLIYFSLLFTGVHYVPAGEASILVQLQVPISVLLSAVFLKEALSFRVVMGIAIALLGVIVTIGIPNRGGSLLGVLLLLGSALMWAISSLQIKVLGKISPLQLNGMMALMAMPQLLVASYFLEHGQWQSVRDFSWAGWIGILYTAVISSILCYSIWFKLIQKYEINKVVPFSLLVPIFGVMASHVVADEPLIPHIIIGGLICIAGLALVVVKKG